MVTGHKPTAHGTAEQLIQLFICGSDCSSAQDALAGNTYTFNEVKHSSAQNISSITVLVFASFFVTEMTDLR